MKVRNGNNLVSNPDHASEFNQEVELAPEEVLRFCEFRDVLQPVHQSTLATEFRKTTKFSNIQQGSHKTIKIATINYIQLCFLMLVGMCYKKKVTTHQKSHSRPYTAVVFI